MKIIFYISGEKQVIGEGVIAKVEKLSPDIAWSSWGPKMIMDKCEFEKYTQTSPITGKPRANKELTVLLLKDLRKYDKSIDLTRSVTPTGCYVTEEQYEALLNNKY